MERFALIVAGGSGSRMQSKIAKQFLKINDKPILQYTIEAFQAQQVKIVLVLPPSQIQFWENQSQNIDYEIVAGGMSRFHSVKNGLSKIPEDALVAIHDGVRPLLSSDLIERCFKAASQFESAIPCIPVIDTLREVINDKSKHVNRQNFRAIQTPQTFKSSIIKKAYLQDFNEDFTDDASVFESSGHVVHLVEGEPKNIKITRPQDLLFTEFFLNLPE
ncbi:MAG: 2-C-methyl-D-erythritol 4-phosphate cytidylyltransferase [Flavobacteriales bacterium]|nr:2-C-methyl-D-erythritol 4-phosphate cytidylyltransferase [Flavobacteriales bacterium]